MEQRTSEHLAKADHHRQVAQALVGPLASQISDSPPLDWAVVAAFYAAVHYVNVYLWETRQYDPGTHPNRGAAVQAEPVLRPAAQAYRRLQDLGFQARYVAHFQPRAQSIQDRVQIDLEAIRHAVRQALGLPG
jgi:hypothetical protein